MLNALGFESGGRWQPLPDWARFFITLGARLFSRENDESRLVVAVTVPTRTLSTAFAALGVVVSDYAREVKEDAQTHFEDLLGQPAGSVVRLEFAERGRRKVANGVLEGTRSSDGNGTLIGVRLSTGEKRWLPMSESPRIQAAAPGNDFRPGDSRRSAILERPTPFVTLALSPLDGRRYPRPNGLDCLVVAPMTAFFKETDECILTATAARKTVQHRGTLTELLRPEMGRAKGGPRTLLMPETSAPAAVRTKATRVTLFDGARPYLRLRTAASSSHIVVFLDRTEPRFGDAIRQLESDYKLRRSGELPSSLGADGPKAIEVFGFRERKRHP